MASFGSLKFLTFFIIAFRNTNGSYPKCTKTYKRGEQTQYAIGQVGLWIVIILIKFDFTMKRGKFATYTGKFIFNS